MPDALEQFAENLRRIREQQGMTQETLAAKSGIDHTSIGRIERGGRDPGVRTVARLADGLGVPASRLLDGIGGESGSARA